MNHSVTRFSHQIPQQPVRYVASVVTDGEGRRMAENNRSLGVLQGGRGRVPRSVGQVHYHPQSVHLLHHGLENTPESHLQTHRKEGSQSRRQQETVTRTHM